MCCDELQIYPDSTVTYSSGKKIEKFDKFGDYFYKENDSLIVLTRIRKTVIGLKIKCKGNDCRIYTANNLLIKSFSKEILNDEIQKADRGEYTFDARNTIERNNKR